MTRFFVFWIALAIVHWAGTAAISFFGFRHVDLTYENFVSFVTVPIYQAAVLTLSARSSPIVIGAHVGSAWRHPLVRPVLLMDAAILLVGWIFRSRHVAGVGGDAALILAWTGTKAIAAGASTLLAVWSVRATTAIATSIPQRSGMTLYGLLLAALGLDAFVPWLASMPDLFAPWPIVLVWLGVYGTLFTAVVAVATWMARRAAEPAPDMAFFLNVAVAAGGLAAVVVVLNVFLHPWLNEPWRSVARMLVTVAATGTLVAGILAAVPRDLGRGV